MVSPEFKLAILASGQGSSSEPMLAEPDLVSLVITNNPKAGIIDRAKNHHIPAAVVTRREHQVVQDDQVNQSASDEAFQRAILNQLRSHHITHIAQQGWLVKTSPEIIDCYPNRIVNSHNGPLDPGYLDLGGDGMYGKRVHYAACLLRRALGPQFVTGPSLHFVDSHYDHGQLLAFTKIGISENDTPESLELRFKPLEALQSLQFWLKVRRTGLIKPIHLTKRLFSPAEYDLVEDIKNQARNIPSH